MFLLPLTCPLHTPPSRICEGQFPANAPPLRSVQTNVCADQPQITIIVHPESGDFILPVTPGLKWLPYAGFATLCYSKASLVSPTKADASCQMEGMVWKNHIPNT